MYVGFRFIKKIFFLGALVSAGFKVSTTVRADENMMKEESDDVSSVNKQDLEAELDRYNTLRKTYRRVYYLLII